MAEPSKQSANAAAVPEKAYKATLPLKFSSGIVEAGEIVELTHLTPSQILTLKKKGAIVEVDVQPGMVAANTARELMPRPPENK